MYFRDQYKFRSALNLQSLIAAHNFASFSVRWYVALRTHRREYANHENDVLPDPAQKLLLWRSLSTDNNHSFANSY